nr:UDP-glucose pyrophosphorylase 2 [Molossus molossus]
MSQGGASQFQEVIRQELELSVKKELEKILITAPSPEFEHTKKDLDGFRKLFHRFLQEKGPSVDWGKIQRPPEDSREEGRRRESNINERQHRLAVSSIPLTGDQATTWDSNQRPPGAKVDAQPLNHASLALLNSCLWTWEFFVFSYAHLTF